MKKKTRGSAPGAPKRRKSGVVEPKGGPQGARRVKVPPGSAPRLSVAPNDAKLAIRRLKVQLAQARARIDELEASADTDFLLDIPNRRGFERELNRAVAYIKRYHAAAASSRCCCGTSVRPMPGPRRRRWNKPSIGSHSCFAAAPSRRAHPPGLRFSVFMRKRGGRWKKPTARCMCARRNAGMKRDMQMQPTWPADTAAGRLLNVSRH